jgi:hypothetical protein
MMVWFHGMATMTHRATFSFDYGTISRLKSLSVRWSVSQAEVIRRALSQAEKTSELILQPDPIKMLASLHASGAGLSKKVGDAYLKEVYEDRKKWRGT